jgi:hypothetical protein
METLRQFYRLGFVEYPLFALFAAQIILGVALILKRGKPKGSWAWVQVILSGYIALFLLQHLGAIVMARINYDFETTTYFAAGVVSGLPYGLCYFPYYLLGIVVAFTDITAAARFAIWPAPARVLHEALPLIGVVFGLSVVTALSYGVADELPKPYQEYLAKSFGD